MSHECYSLVPWVCLQFVIVVFLDYTHLLFLLLCQIKSIEIQYGKHIAEKNIIGHRSIAVANTYLFDSL